MQSIKRECGPQTWTLNDKLKVELAVLYGGFRTQFSDPGSRSPDLRAQTSVAPFPVITQPAGRDSHSSSLSEQYPDWAAEDMFDHPAPCELVKEKTKSEESLSDLTGSLLSLQLDLGPSFLDEVLNVMDKNK